ncbi:YadA-like family protein [Xanthomonas sacchari]|uniref:YadA-like family protein n=1 Tax=Xanthomonas sacchari TaxID=56458 RepID=UPI002434C11C|nr:YadA-like family protein [Xanthomonas sacchari]
MNKVFKIVWNRAVGAWVIVSELAKAKGGLTSRKVVERRLSVPCAGVAFFGVVATLSGSAYAQSQADVDHQFNTGILETFGFRSQSNSPACSGAWQNSGQQGWGFGGNDLGITGGDFDTVKRNGIANICSFADAATQKNRILTWANNSDSSVVNMTVGGKFYANTAAYLNNATINNLTLTGAVNLPYFSVNSTQSTGTASGSDGIAIGMGSTNAGGASSIAVGNGAVASGSAAIAQGKGATASGQGALALGSQNEASSTNAIALGTSSAASGSNSVAIGGSAKANGATSTAIGATATASQTSALALGNKSTASGVNSLAAGSGATASGQSSMAVGVNLTANAKGAIAVGDSVTASGVGAIAIGSYSDWSALNTAAGRDSIAIGNAANSQTQGAIAIGNRATASANQDDVALGSSSTTSAVVATKSSAINGATYAYAGTTPSSTVSVGSAGKERTVTNVAAGRVAATSTDAVNGSQLFATNTEVTSVGGKVSTLGDQVTNLNTTVTNLQEGKGIKYVHTNSTGADSVASGTDSTAVGVAATAYGDSALALGDSAVAGQANTDDKPKNAATIVNDVALGKAAKATGGNSLALGAGASAGQAGAVALGAGSSTAAAVATTGATINGTAYAYAGTAPASTVSVGSAGKERTVTNVAAGRVAATSTDAVNGSQLFATNTEVTSVGGKVSTLGDQVTNLNTTVTNLQEGKGIKYVHTNSTGADSVASGTDSTAVGVAATAYGDSALALGDSAVAGQANTDDKPKNAATIVNDVALGKAAKATGGNSLALGAGASAGQAGAVALGAGSSTAAAVATTGATINGTAYTYAGTAPVSTVSVGSAGKERTVTNVAAGRVAATSTDAVNGSQLFATNTEVTSVGGKVTEINKVLEKLKDGTGVKYVNTNSTGADSVASGTDSTAVGVAATAYGDSALALGDSAVAGQANTDDKPKNAATIVNDVALGKAAKATGGNSLALGAGASAGQAGAVALGAGSSTAAAVATTGATINGTAYTYAGTAPVSTVSVGSAGKERTVTNVAAGRVAATSTDAVNGSQLNATNTELGNVGSKLTELDSTVKQFQSGKGVKYINTNSTGADSVASGTDSTAIGVAANAAGSGSMAVGNGASALGGDSVAQGSNADASGLQAVAQGRDASASGGYSVAQGASANANGAGSIAIGHAASADAKNALAIGSNAMAYYSGDVALGSGSSTGAAVSTEGVVLNGHSYSFAGAAPTSTVSVGSEGNERTITNVAAGRLSDTSTDAVNGSQLHATNTELTKLDDAVKGIQGGDGVKYMRINSSGGDSAATGTDSLAIGPDAVAGNASDVAIGAGARTAATSAVESTTLGGSSYSFAGSTPAGAFSVGAVGAERQIQNVAAGRLSATSTDAVNGSQLYATNQKVQENSGSISALQSSMTTMQQTIAQGGATAGGIVVGGTPSTQAIDFPGSSGEGSQVGQIAQVSPVVVGNNGTSVAVGHTATASNTNATSVGNNSQASGVNATAMGADAVASGVGSVAVGKGAKATEANSVALGQGSVADRANSVSVGSASNQRQITNVAAGTERTDAVNLGQMNDGLNGVADWSRNYTDSRVDQADRRASAGVAAAMAMASLPQAYQPDQSAAGVSLSSFRGEQAIAVGVSKISESGRYLFKVNASATTRGDAGVAVGAGMVW